MRILFLSSIYPRSYDRVFGIYTYSVCKYLALKHDVRVISPQSWVERVTKPSAHDDQLSANIGPTVYPCYYYPPKLFRDRYADFMWASIRGTVRRVVAEFRPDCVLSYWAHPDGEVAVRAAKEAGIPVGIIVGGSDVLLLPRSSRRKQAIARALSGADAVFTVSQDLRDKVIDLSVDPEKVHVFHQGVDEQFSPGDQPTSRARFGIDPKKSILLWVGRMAPVKGLEVLMEACAILRTKHDDFELILVGDGPLRSEVQADAARLGLAGRTRFVGMVPQEQLPDWYRAADLTVLSSYSEGIPNVLRESLACGTPYVATRVGGVAELSDDPLNRLVPPGDALLFADAMAAALAVDRRYSPHGQFHGWDEYAEKLLSVLRPDLAVVA